MRLAVLGSTQSWYLQDLRRAAEGTHQVLPATFRGVRSLLACGDDLIASGEVDLTEVEAVLVRTMPAASLEQVVFRMDALAELERRGVTVVNPPKAIEAAVDKYLATARLNHAGLAVPKTIACQTAEDAFSAFQSLGGDVVAKPLFGAEGRGIARLDNEDLAWRACKLYEQWGTVIYLQEFIEHEGCDLRLFVLGDHVWGMRRSNSGDWRTNVSRGASTEPLEVTDDLAELAKRAATAVGAVVAGVDILPGRDGGLYVLEVNAVPGWQALSRTLRLDVAKHLLSYLCAQI